MSPRSAGTARTLLSEPARSRRAGPTRPRGRLPGRAILAALVPALLAPAAATADVWVFEPSISLDQRFDDNYRLETGIDRGISATRAVADFGLSRESPTAAFRGAVRFDGLLTQGDYEGDELDSNQVLFLDSSFRDALTTWNLGLSFKQDTPSRDISADLSGEASAATDNGVVTQRSNVARRRFVIAPSVTRELTRRASTRATLTYTAVEHDLPSVEDTIYEQYLRVYNNPRRPDTFPVADGGGPLPPEEVSGDTVGVFTPSGELDDYQEAKLDLGYRYALSPISAASATVSLSRYEADVEAIDVTFDQLVRDGQNDIYRRPRGRESLSTTSSFRLGYERSLTPTLELGLQGGLYYNTTDETDTYRRSDRPDVAYDEERLESLESSENGWLANVTLSKDAGLTRYTGRFGVDVQPSSIGSQVEAQELIGDLYRRLTPLLDFAFRVRAYEPDRLGANPDDAFARRFLSAEPKLIWRFSRAWTASAAYRYRRQKSRVETESGESNALLFSLRYSPPSAIRDAAGAR